VRNCETDNAAISRNGAIPWESRGNPRARCVRPPTSPPPPLELRIDARERDSSSRTFASLWRAARERAALDLDHGGGKTVSRFPLGGACCARGNGAARMRISGGLTVSPSRLRKPCHRDAPVRRRRRRRDTRPERKSISDLSLARFTRGPTPHCVSRRTCRSPFHRALFPPPPPPRCISRLSSLARSLFRSGGLAWLAIRRTRWADAHESPGERATEISSARVDALTHINPWR